MGTQLHHGECLSVLREFDAASIDAVVTDPPYDLTGISRNGSSRVAGTGPFGRHTIGTKAGGFMGKEWDGTGVAFRPETWAEVLRVLKPGGYLVAFGGTRTYHRMACAIEDAGFTIKDSLHWLYGSGFPKSLNLGDGIGTALKPACEPIVLAQRPLDGTYAANMAKWGTGGLNIDGCRIGDTKDVPASSSDAPNNIYGAASARKIDRGGMNPNIGRWPANVLLDAWDEPVARLRYNIPDDAQRVIGEYYRDYRRVPTVRASYRDLSQPEGPDAVLQSGVLCGVDERASRRRSASDVRQEAPARLDREDGRAETGDGEAWCPGEELEGRAAPGAGLRDGGDLDTLPGGAGAFCPDGDAQQPARDPGASASDGPEVGPSALALGDRASQERHQDGQSPGESGSDRQRRSQEGPSGGLAGTQTTARPKRITVAPSLLVLECDIPPGWRHYFEPTGLTIPSPDSAAALLDAQSGERKAGGYVSGLQASATGDNGIYGHFDRIENSPYGDTGGASRFFYVAKASRSERDTGLAALPVASGGEITDRQDGSAGLNSPRAGAGRTSGGRNTHPTVKPVALMRWLVRLVTPEGGTVLDPFAGSGTTLVAAIEERREAIGIEMTEEYLPIIRARTDHAAKRPVQHALPLGAAD